MDKQYAALQNEKQELLLFAIFMIGSVEILLFGITRKFVSNPVKKLNIGANEIANGNLSHRVNIESYDEIGELSNSFNSMASDLNVSLKKMEESNEWFSKIFVNSYDAINISHNGITKYVNPAYVSLFKYGESDLIGKPFDIVLDHNSAANIKRYLSSISEKNNIHKRIEVIGYTKNSNKVFLEVSLSSMEIKSETYLIAILNDITERKRAEETHLKNIELKKSNELKDMFTDIMRHDLLNPANTIQGYSQLLLDKEEDEQKKRFLKNITNSTKGLIEMVESASMVAKLENVEDLDVEHLDLGLIINEIVNSFELQLEQKQMDINLEMSGYYPVLANNMIGEVFRNLISNSIKYSPDGSTIIIKIVDENSYWKIEVVDEGEGISDEDKPYVFDRFTRVNKGNIKGTGLGLFIVKKIVDLHDGNVGVTDNPYGKGSLFFIRLKKIDTTI
ncbi:PAS domain S-box protein [Methanohalophilus sp. RSK]|uniref:ATP-binding protein n=1 Tax=Methanohalophilus sp. RSK TaxID=2485783 RepID=UPI000F43AA20|nr:ATP-binding protein [Methanohalophilus sp. RSK]RNI15470.1 PAS domain S-box protein [Methanohalophilus sp. RSK]